MVAVIVAVGAFTHQHIAMSKNTAYLRIGRGKAEGAPGNFESPFHMRVVRGGKRHVECGMLERVKGLEKQASRKPGGSVARTTRSA